MKKRIFAWVLLAGFFLLLLNLIFFKFYWQLSMVVYLIIVFAFLLTNGKFTAKDANNTVDIEDIEDIESTEDTDDAKHE